jgi:hypothetical protein
MPAGTDFQKFYSRCGFLTGAPAWVRGGGTWRRGRAACVGRVPSCGDSDACRRWLGERVRSWASWCLPAVQGRTCVGAWAGGASGGSFVAFAPVDIWTIAWLLRWGPVLCRKVVEGQPWVPDWSTVGPRFLGGNRGSPHKNLQPWVPATSFLFCVRWATRPNCQPLTLSHLESDGGPTSSMPSAARPHCILPARNLETLTIF